MMKDYRQKGEETATVPRLQFVLRLNLGGIKKYRNSWEEGNGEEAEPGAYTLVGGQVGTLGFVWF